MSWFLWAATGGSPTGFVLFSFIAQGRSWHQVFRIMFFICFSFWIVLVLALYALGETRHSVILLRRARALRKETGDERIEVPDEMKQRGPKQLFSTALARPFRFLAGEAIVQFGAAYNGFLYGLSFLFNGAFHMIFGPKGYGFDTIGVGTCRPSWQPRRTRSACPSCKTSCDCSAFVFAGFFISCNTEHSSLLSSFGFSILGLVVLYSQ
jgi:hypothetical protein